MTSPSASAASRLSRGVEMAIEGCYAVVPLHCTQVVLVLVVEADGSQCATFRGCADADSALSSVKGVVSQVKCSSTRLKFPSFLAAVLTRTDSSRSSRLRYVSIL
jgi:hypothetical protein